MKFESAKDKLIGISIFLINVFLTGVMGLILLKGDMGIGIIFPIVLLLAVIGLLFWLYFGTYYKLSKEEGFTYRNGPFKGQISIDRITEIVKGKTIWVGFKPATAKNGLVIKYDKFNEIYISPKTNETFISKILELNKEIRISE